MTTAATAATPVRYRVSAPMINVRVPGSPLATGRNTAWTKVGYFENAWLPEGVHPDDITHHLELGMIEPV